MANIIFVDDQDNVIGAGPKLEALENGIRHRISRVFIKNSSGEILLQKRAPGIFSNPGKWDQSAAGHVDEGETYEQAARRELQEEVGISSVPLTEIGYYYLEETDEELPKKKFNRIYAGTYDGEVHPDPNSVSEVKWISLPELDLWMDKRPEEFTQGCLYAYKFVRKLL